MIHNTKYLIPFLYTFLIAVVAVSFLLWFGKKYDFSKNAKRFGGAVVILVFILLVLLDKNLVITKPIAGILIGGMLILFFGIWDDLKNLNWKWQLVFQIIIAVAAISFGVRSEYIASPMGGVISLQNPLIYIVFYILYFLFFINSLNWLDGIDGLSGGVTLVALSVIFFLSFLPHVNQPAVAILSAIASGAILGFFIFNWHPAKIIAGTSGAWFFGFLLASFSIFAGAKIATVMMVALIPVLDLIRVVIERWRSGKSIFSRDDRHLHYFLQKRGFSERKIVVLVCFLSLLVGILALSLNSRGKLVTMIVVALIYLLIFPIWQKRQA
jgi:UDP-GlcNAc:undecaprenyl-phosphate/decaprenyl-phosphate GlcNAc-1-phosphate transferase